MTRREKLLCIPLAATIAAWLMAPTGGYPSQPTFISALIGATTPGGNMGSGTLNANALYVQGTAVSTAAGANPTASVALTAVNGSATTYMRSDAAPPINTAITPTWTGQHTFSGGALGSSFAFTGAGSVGGVMTVGNGLSGSFAAPQLNIETGQYGIGVDASGNWFAKNTNNGHYYFTTSSGGVDFDIAQTGATVNSVGGAGLTVNATLSNVGNFNSTGANGGYVCTQNSGGNVLCLGSALSLYGGAIGDSALAAQGATNLSLATNGANRLNVGPTGAVSISAPVVSTPVLLINSAAASTGVEILSGNSATAVAADFYISRNGSTANQIAEGPGLQLNDATNSQATFLQQAGGQFEIWQFLSGGWAQDAHFGTLRGFVVGAPTGGDQGQGTVNAQNLFVNGVAVATATSSPMVIQLSFTGGGNPTISLCHGCGASPSATRTAIGSYTITHNKGFASVTYAVVCTTNNGGAAVYLALTGASSVNAFTMVTNSIASGVGDPANTYIANCLVSI